MYVVQFPQGHAPESRSQMCSEPRLWGGLRALNYLNVFLFLQVIPKIQSTCITLETEELQPHRDNYLKARAYAISGVYYNSLIFELTNLISWNLMSLIGMLETQKLTTAKIAQSLNWKANSAPFKL